MQTFFSVCPWEERRTAEVVLEEVCIRKGNNISVSALIHW